MIFVIMFCLLWLPIRFFYPYKIIGKKNLPKKKGYVVTCNHYGNLDPIILNIYLNKKIRFLAKKELFKTKISNAFMRGLGAFPVDREKPDISAFKFALKTLNDDKILGIFPEGTRNRETGEDQMLEFKNGAIVFASKGNAPIVPMIIYRRNKIFRRNYLVIGEPIEIEGVDKKRLTSEEVELNTNRLIAAMNGLRSDLDNKLQIKKQKRKK